MPESPGPGPSKQYRYSMRPRLAGTIASSVLHFVFENNRACALGNTPFQYKPLFPLRTWVQRQRQTDEQDAEEEFKYDTASRKSVQSLHSFPANPFTVPLDPPGS